MAGERDWGTALSDMASAFVDSMANSRSTAGSLIGGVLQAGMNTADFQNKRRLSEINMAGAEQKLQRSSLELEEGKKNIPVNDAARARNMLEHQEYASESGVKSRESHRQSMIAAANEKTSPEALALQKAKMALQLRTADEQLLAAENATVHKNLQRMADQSGMSLYGQEEFANSPEFRSMAELSTAFRLYTQAKNNPAYSNALGTFLRNHGYEITRGEDGGDILAGGGRMIPINGENFDRVTQMVKGDFEKEMTARRNLAGARDNVLKNTLGSVASASAPAFNGSYSKTIDAFSSHLKQYSEPQRNEFLLCAGYRDAMRDGKVTPEEQAALWPQVKAYADKLGLRVNVNSEDPARSAVEISGQLVPVGEFVTRLEAGNTIMKDWNGYLLNAARSAVNKKLNADAHSGDDPEQNETGASYIAAGTEFVKDHKLEGTVNAIWENRRDKKAMANKEDVYKYIARAAEEAEDAFSREADDSKAYAKASEAFKTCLKSAGVPSELIPELWKDADLKEKFTAAEKEEKEIVKQRNELKKSGRMNEKVSAFPSTLSNPYGGLAYGSGADQSLGDKNFQAYDSILQKKSAIYDEQKSREAARKKSAADYEEQKKRREKFKGTR